MRLLTYNNNGIFSLENFGNYTRRYAILSHTWGADIEEVIFRDLVDSTSKSKAGYKKIRFYGARAMEDCIEYFWIDTYYINKSNSTELIEAINSMFR
jgi:hypothetical protein